MASLTQLLQTTLPRNMRTAKLLERRGAWNRATGQKCNRDDCIDKNVMEW
jgi:hypothetical protein